MNIDELSTPLSLPALVDGKPHAPVKKTGSKEPVTAARDTSTNTDVFATQLPSNGGNDKNSPMMSASKIAEIKQAISEGRFQINSSAVADSLIETIRSFR